MLNLRFWKEDLSDHTKQDGHEPEGSRGEAKKIEASATNEAKGRLTMACGQDPSWDHRGETVERCNHGATRSVSKFRV